MRKLFFPLFLSHAYEHCSPLVLLSFSFFLCASLSPPHVLALFHTPTLLSISPLLLFITAATLSCLLVPLQQQQPALHQVLSLFNRLLTSQQQASSKFFFQPAAEGFTCHFLARAVILFSSSSQQNSCFIFLFSQPTTAGSNSPLPVSRNDQQPFSTALFQLQQVLLQLFIAASTQLV